MAPPIPFSQEFFQKMGTHIASTSATNQEAFYAIPKDLLDEWAKQWTPASLALAANSSDEILHIKRLRDIGFGWDDFTGMVIGSENMWNVFRSNKDTAFLAQWQTKRCEAYQMLVDHCLEVDKMEAMESLKVDEHGNAEPDDYAAHLILGLEKSAEHFKVSLQQANKATATNTAPGLTTDKAQAILNFVSKPAQLKPLKSVTKKTKLAPMVATPPTRVYPHPSPALLDALPSPKSSNKNSDGKREPTCVYTADSLGHPDTVRRVMYTTAPSIESAAKPDEENGKRPAQNEDSLVAEQAPSKSSKGRAAKKRSAAVAKLANVKDGNTEKSASGPSASVSPPHAEAAATTHTHQAHIEDVEDEAYSYEDHDHDPSQCTCNCLLSTIAITPMGFPPTILASFVKQYSKLPILIDAATLKLRADHLHNMWFCSIAMLSECRCWPCRAPYSPSYSNFVIPAKKAYQRADAWLDEFLEEKREVVQKEIVKVLKAEGRKEEAVRWRVERMSNVVIKKMLPDGRDAEVEREAKGKGKVDMAAIMSRLGLN